MTEIAWWHLTHWENHSSCTHAAAAIFRPFSNLPLHLFIFNTKSCTWGSMPGFLKNMKKKPFWALNKLRQPTSASTYERKLTHDRPAFVPILNSSDQRQIILCFKRSTRLSCGLSLHSLMRFGAQLTMMLRGAGQVAACVSWLLLRFLFFLFV